MKKKFILLSVFLLLFILEVLIFFYFRFISNDHLNLEFYKEKRNASLSYNYFENVGLVLPKIKDKNDLIVTHYVKEFVDRFTFRDILGLEIGFPDDGIDDRKFKSVAIGDSFTRGVGSIDNLKNGWVELIEKKNKDIDIINLGHLGSGINDQKYKYDKLKKFIDHDIIIYNFFSTHDYKDNLSDFEYSIYVKKFYNKFGKEETQKLINDLNIRHGYKHHLEYLLNNRFKSYSIYFSLKIIDYLINIKMFPAYKFLYEIPKDQIRLNIVDDSLFQIHENKSYDTLVCENKYCFYNINKQVVDQMTLNKIILNSAKMINQFYQESLANNKKFIFVLHPNAGHFYANKGEYNHAKLDEKLLKLLDKRIEVINVGKNLIEINKKDKNKTFFYKYDGHYNIEGYKTVSEIINKELSKFLK
jgi:hypothetical protein